MKPWYKSWTLWVNSIGAAAIGFLGILTENGETSQWVVIGLAVANMALRVKTAPLSL